MWAGTGPSVFVLGNSVSSGLSGKEGQPHKARMVKRENQSFQKRGALAVEWSRVIARL